MHEQLSRQCDGSDGAQEEKDKAAEEAAEAAATEPAAEAEVSEE